MRSHVLLTALGLLAGVSACSTATDRPAYQAASHEPSLDDFAADDRDAVAAMLRDTAEKFWSPFWALPGSREVTILLVCRVQFVRAGVVGVECLSRAPELGLATGDHTEFYYDPDWAEKEFGVSAGALAAGDVRTCVVHGSGFGGNLWKRFLIFPGPAR